MCEVVVVVGRWWMCVMKLLEVGEWDSLKKKAASS